MTSSENDTQSAAFHDLIERSLAAIVSTKNRNWNEEEYQNGVVEPYRNVQRLFYGMEQNGTKPGIHQVRNVLFMVKSVFDTKKLRHEEQVQWFGSILKSPELCELFHEYKE